MEYLVICLAAIFISTLTLFSGFGLGTLLVPFFCFFFPVDISVALTAVVHFLNNLFKLGLLGKHMNKRVVLGFGVPGIFAAFLGAKVLFWFSHLEPMGSYEFFGRILTILPVKLVIAILLAFFALFEVLPQLKNLSFDQKFLPLGGALSGFFGGVSGNQGAFRSAFLMRCGLSKESFIGTGVAIACLIDITRLSVYGSHFLKTEIQSNSLLLIAATLSAFLGAWVGNRLMKKITMRAVQILVAILLFIFAFGLSLGFI